MCTPHEFRALVEKYSNVGCSLDGELPDAWRVGLAASHVMRQRWAEQLRKHAGKPTLFVYMNDGWSTDVSEVVTAGVGEFTTRNEGRVREEFLLERTFLRHRRADGGSDLSIIVAPPKALKHGKTALCMFATGVQFVSPLRPSGHSGLLFNLYVFDGPNVSYAQTRLFFARNDLWYSEEFGGCAPADAFELKNSEFNLGLRCRIHAANKGVEWGLKPVSRDDAIIDETFIVISSLLKSSASVHARIDVFLQRHMAFDAPVDSPNDLATYWETLGVVKSLLPLFLLRRPSLGLHA